MRDVGLSEGRGRELYFWLYIFRRREAVRGGKVLLGRVDRVTEPGGHDK